MRSFVGIIIIILFVACTRNKSVQVSGRVETGDTVVYFQVNDSLHKFRLDEKHYFSGKIELENGYLCSFHSLFDSSFFNTWRRFRNQYE